MENGEKFEVSTILVAAGRVPNLEKLDLEKAGIEYDSSGIKVNEFLQTDNEDVFAVGDCLPGPKFTHNSDIQARYAVRNALFEDNCSQKDIILPSCTYTDP